MSVYPLVFGLWSDEANEFWSFLQIRSCKLGSLLYATTIDEEGKMKLNAGSNDEAALNAFLTAGVKTVVAGWSDVTKGITKLSSFL